MPTPQNTPAGRAHAAMRDGPIFADFERASLRGQPGFFRLGRTDDGVWWLITPEDEPTFLRAIAGVNRHGRAGPELVRRSVYANTVEHLYGSAAKVDEGWGRSTAARLHAWGVDTVGPWADAGLVNRGFYFTAIADFVRASVPTLHGPGVRLPDVFDPNWPLAAEAHAAAVAAPWAVYRFGVRSNCEAARWAATSRPSAIRPASTVARCSSFLKTIRREPLGLLRGGVSALISEVKLPSGFARSSASTPAGLFRSGVSSAGAIMWRGSLIRNRLHSRRSRRGFLIILFKAQDLVPCL